VGERFSVGVNALAKRRISAGTYGTCEICQEQIEGDRLHADPLVRSCTSHLAPEELGRVVNDKRLASTYLDDPRTPETSLIPGASFEVGSRPSGSPLHLGSLRQWLVKSLRSALRVFEGREFNRR